MPQLPVGSMRAFSIENESAMPRNPSSTATRASGPEQTDILGLRGLPSASSGLPVIDTASSKLVGLSLGPDHPGLAVAARHLFALLEEAKQSSPTPFGK